MIIRAETDCLTGFYNKGAIQLKIEKALDESTYITKNALLIIDIDNFKYANDTFEHQFGDTLLVELGATIKNLFRGNDLLGRLGGDEFMFLMRNTPEEALIKQKIETLLSNLRAIKIGNSKHLTVSIGIAFFPEHGKTYDELYRAADIALYNAKNSGKNCFCVYESGISMGDVQKKTKINYNSILERGFDRDIVFKVFEMLQDAKDLSVAINKILAMLGEFFAVDCSYIFASRFLPDGQIVYDNTYEWCGEGIEPVIDMRQAMPD